LLHRFVDPVSDVYTLQDLASGSGALVSLDLPIRLGVFGDPIEHSLSPVMQNAALHECGLQMSYARFLIKPNELENALQAARQRNFVGINLTVPHKVAAIELVDELDEEARRTGATNTIVFRDGRMVGYNTDGIGFARAIRNDFSVDLKDLRVLLLGAGGAGRAIAWQCARANCERLAVTNRTFEKAKELVTELQPQFSGPRVLGPVARLEAAPWNDKTLTFQIEHSDLVVNATPVGLNPTDPSVLPATLLAPHLMVFDTVYSKRRTPLLTAAAEAGARGADGLSMLLHQGARSFETWFGREAPLDAMRKALFT
jgi:shikimate dehydrogenase